MLHHMHRSRDKPLGAQPSHSHCCLQRAPSHTWQWHFLATLVARCSIALVPARVAPCLWWMFQGAPLHVKPTCLHRHTTLHPTASSKVSRVLVLCLRITQPIANYATCHPHQLCRTPPANKKAVFPPLRRRLISGAWFGPMCASIYNMS
jgi:hypothetical protein